MKLILLLPILFLSGCAGIQTCMYGPKVITKEVLVPTPIPCPIPPTIEKPELTYTSETEFDKMVRAIQTDMTKINQYVIDLEKALDVYRTKE